MDISEIIKDCVFPESYCRSLYTFLKERNGVDEALEIGFDSGSSALMYLAARPNGRLTSVDIRDLPAAEELVRKHKFMARHQTIVGDSAVVLQKLIEEGNMYDYIYIDGDHLYNGVRKDLELSHMLLATKGVMVVDDCVPGHGLFGVYEAVEDFMKAHPEYVKETLPENPNLACILYRK